VPYPRPCPVLLVAVIHIITDNVGGNGTFRIIYTGLSIYNISLTGCRFLIVTADAPFLLAVFQCTAVINVGYQTAGYPAALGTYIRIINPVIGAARTVAGIADIGVGQGMIARGIKVLEISGSRKIPGVMAVDA
jgi:hypothetical protein